MTRTRNLDIVAALALLLATSGCLTTRVIDRAFDRYPTHARITEVKGAATLNADLYLVLGLTSEKFDSTGTVMLKIPLRDIGAGRSSVRATSIEQDGLQLRAPYVGTFEPTSALPAAATPVTIHEVPNDPSKAHYDLELDMEDWIYSRPPGIYVMVVPYFLEDTETKLKSSPLPIGTIPRNGYLLVVRRDADHAPRKQRMWGFDEYTKKRRALLFLTPLTVVGDIVTFPFQLIYMLGD